MSIKVFLLFPPNWSACVNGPHLALPLLSGVSRNYSESRITVWDLSLDYYNHRGCAPLLTEITQPATDGDYKRLDWLYFQWQDRYLPSQSGESGFGLLSGFSFPVFQQLPLAEIAFRIQSGEETAYSSYYRERVLPRLSREAPQVIGLSIASSNQVVPAIELLICIREHLPETLLILGGNVVTRLRKSSAFQTFRAFVDQIVLFQGEIAFENLLKKVNLHGVRAARYKLRPIVSNEEVPLSTWPVPRFNGISLLSYPGIPVLPFVSTRGCYWGKYTFCTISAGWSSKGFGGSAPSEMIAPQIRQMAEETRIPRIKFVDEAFPPSKARHLSSMLKHSEKLIEWEAYARLESDWEDLDLLSSAYDSGLRKLYFGLEQASPTNRALFNKKDRGDVLSILNACHQVGIKIHLFCMVGLPGTTIVDAHTTVNFLIDHQDMIDTADLVGFRLDRGTSVPGVQPVPNQCDWKISLDYTIASDGILPQLAIIELEQECQERLWESVPRLLHPLYRIIGPWDSSQHLTTSTPGSLHAQPTSC